MYGDDDVRNTNPNHEDWTFLSQRFHDNISDDTIVGEVKYPFVFVRGRPERYVIIKISVGMLRKAEADAEMVQASFELYEGVMKIFEKMPVEVSKRTSMRRK